MSNLIQVAQNVYEHRAEIAEACAAIAGGVGAVCSFAAHYLPLPAKWAERLARFSTYTSQRFSVNDRKRSPPTTVRQGRLASLFADLDPRESHEAATLLLNWTKAGPESRVLISALARLLSSK